MTKLRTLAIDTENFGLFPFHSDHPHTISLCDQDYKVTVYTADHIDDSKRRAVWFSKTLKEIKQRIKQADVRVFHNMKYDVLMLETLEPGLSCFRFGAYPDSQLDEFQDTATLSHIVYNDEPHGLKPLTFKYRDIPPTDDHLLHEVINEVHNLRRGYDRAIAKGKPPKPKHLHIDYLPHQLDAAGDDDDESSNKCDFHLARHHPNPVLRKACEVYAGRDAYRALLLWEMYLAELSENGDLHDRYEAIQRLYMREKRLNFALINQAANPIHLRKRTLVAFIKKAERTTQSLEKTILTVGRKYCPDLDNINSDDQIRELLFNKLNLPVQELTEKSKLPSTNGTSLKALLSELTDQRAKTKAKRVLDSFEVVHTLVEYNKTNTLLTYSENYQRFAMHWRSKEPYVLFNLNTIGTKFVRGSSSKPNLQNVGSKDKDKDFARFLEGLDDNSLYGTSLRSNFGPPAGYVWYSFDYSQIELQVFARLCRSKRLIQLLAESDVHDAVERGLFGTSGENRTLAKIASFRIIYGILEHNFDKAYFPGGYKKYTTELFPEAGEFLADCIAQVEANGYVETESGYRIHIPHNKGYIGSNARCQGTAADIIKLAMVAIAQYLYQVNRTIAIKPILQIHDELVFLAKQPVGPKQKTIQQEQLYVVRRLMGLAADHYGVPCKTDQEIIRTSWDKPDKYSFTLTDAQTKRLNREADKIMSLVT